MWVHCLKTYLHLEKTWAWFSSGQTLNTLQSIPPPVSAIKRAAKLMCPHSGWWPLVVSAAQEGQLRICPWIKLICLALIFKYLNAKGLPETRWAQWVMNTETIWTSHLLWYFEGCCWVSHTQNACFQIKLCWLMFI